MAELTATDKAKVQPRLAVIYHGEIRQQLRDELKLHNLYEVPQLEKIVINAGLGRAKDEKRLIEVAENTILKITGQKPVRTVAKSAIASFKLREGNTIGVKLTLRGSRMYEFADRFINLVLPRLRDFHGVPVKSFDKQGNYSIGLVDQSVFPELTYDDYATTHGLQVIFNIKARDQAHGRALLKKLGMPFEKEGAK